MEHQLRLESQQNIGSTFYFTIPYTVQPTNETKTSIIENLPDTFQFQNQRVLVVEDDPYNVAYIKEILSDIGLDLVYAETGNEAIALAISHNPDLILMDIGLPDMMGYEAIRQIKKHNPNFKIIAQTAYAGGDDKAKAINAGCIEHISKPLKAKKLLSLINKHLS